jgi:hypothetical protein
MATEGVIAPLTEYVQVYLNGRFYGLYGLVEDVSTAVCVLCGGGGAHC